MYENASFYRVIQVTADGPVTWGTFETQEQLEQFMVYMLHSVKNHAQLDSFRVVEFYTKTQEENFLAYAAFLGLGYKKEERG